MAGIQPDAEQQRLLDAQKETAEAIAWWTNIIILVSFGLLLLAFTPDSLVISDNAATEMPFIGSASIKLVLISGPLVLLLLRMFLSSYLGHWNRLERAIGHLKPRHEATLTLMQNQRLRRWAGFVHFPMIALVLIATTWRGLGFPLWGEFMTLLTIVVVLWLTYRAARSGRWFNMTILLGLIAATAIAIPASLMEYNPDARRGFRAGTDIQERGLTVRRAAYTEDDRDEDNYSGSLFWVRCSSPKGRERRGAPSGCIGNEPESGTIFIKEESPTLDGVSLNLDRKSIKRTVNTLLVYVNRFFFLRRRLDLSGASMERADLRFLNLQWASFTHANLPYALFRHARLQQATFTGADLRGANFANAKLWNTELRRAKLNEANFWNASLQNADLRRADLRHAILMRANLTDAKLRGANLQCANLSRATLTNADLSRADLRETVSRRPRQRSRPDGRAAPRRRARGTDFTGVILTCADLRGANLTGVWNLTQTQLDQACTDSRTRLPTGLKPPKTACDSGSEKGRCKGWSARASEPPVHCQRDG